VAQIVKADLPHPRRPQSLLEATHERAIGKHIAVQRIGENEVVLVAEARAPKVGSECVFDPA
jgi:hypothetical protein